MLFDLVGALTSLLSTYFFIRLNNKAWPIGILATILNGWLYWHKGIYADMMLEMGYFLSMCYGWSIWYKQSLIKDNSTQKPLGTLTMTQWLWLMLTLVAVFLFIFYILHNLTHSTVAILDAATTSLSLVAQWLMCHKIIATWVLWFITDALFAVMYLNKNLPFHCVLMLIYTGMAIAGYLVWARKSKVFSNNDSNYKEHFFSV
ncbi:Nicotinamide riboside transporter PnuC [Legionella moravica]|uniref:Nicotinamide riboside transporter PnuC n=1 Tax=Legionella moravica TaxID=39962 RepID=A0A378JYW7_9GAMM|nr:nicotinamide riboside transporter PnuC [Legionella moravica]KTD31856.1 Nicotinamide riboside transporter PnuC [Legionella moravica]STX63237.1 nicotinamide riboside transporter PnuC [Legionella moravica]